MYEVRGGHRLLEKATRTLQAVLLRRPSLAPKRCRASLVSRSPVLTSSIPLSYTCHTAKGTGTVETRTLPMTKSYRPHLLLQHFDCRLHLGVFLVLALLRQATVVWHPVDLSVVNLSNYTPGRPDDKHSTVRMGAQARTRVCIHPY